jgi:hypothetical protein
MATGVFEARHSHVGVRRCYRSKISKSGFIRVTIGLTELVTGETMASATMVVSGAGTPSPPTAAVGES